MREWGCIKSGPKCLRKQQEGLKTQGGWKTYHPPHYDASAPPSVWLRHIIPLRVAIPPLAEKKESPKESPRVLANPPKRVKNESPGDSVSQKSPVF